MVDSEEGDDSEGRDSGGAAPARREGVFWVKGHQVPERTSLTRPGYRVRFWPEPHNGQPGFT